MTDDTLYQVALTQVPYIGAVHAKILLAHFESARSIFKSREQELGKIEGIGRVRARSIARFNNFNRAAAELLFLEKYKIEPLFLNATAYPKRLLHCADPPTLLYFRGNADLNAARIISVIGTRCNSDYGRQVTEKLIRELAPFNILVASGLAFGIDALHTGLHLKQACKQ